MTGFLRFKKDFPAFLSNNITKYILIKIEEWVGDQMKFKITMASGKEYIVHSQSFAALEEELKNPDQDLKNSLVYLDREQTLKVNPSHISCVEKLVEQTNGK